MNMMTHLQNAQTDVALTPFNFVLFKNELDPQPRRVDTSSGWKGLCELLSSHELRPDKSGRGFSPITLRPGTTRKNENVIELYALAIDCDSGLPFEEALKRVGKHEHFAYTTYSHTPEHPRYRIVLPLQRPVSATDWKMLHAAAVAEFGADLIDKACSDPSRMYYLPACPRERKFNCWTHYRPGPFLDPQTLIPMEPASRTAARSVSVSPAPVSDTLNDDLTIHLQRPTLADLESALSYLDPDEDYDLWLRIGWGIAHGTGQSDEGKALFDRFSAGNLCGKPAAKYKGGADIDRVWDGYDPLRQPRVTVGTLFHMASQRGWRPASRTTPLTPAELLAYPTGDSTNAKLFAGRVCDHLLFNCSQSVWMAYDGVIWRKAEHGEEMAAAKKFAYGVMASVADLLRLAGEQPRAREWFRAAQQLLNRPRLEAMLELAKSEPRMMAVQSEFDADPYLLATHNGVVDLRSGQLQAARPDMRLSRCAGAAYDRSKQCPRFLQFLDEITGGDRALQESMQRMCGYWLTGDVSEEKMVFAFGAGANGKSVFANVLSAVLGGYCMTAPPSLLEAQANRGSVRPEIAGMAGARLVLANETEDGVPWDAQLIKSLVSTERISARFLYANYIEFQPTAKIFVRGNHKPIVRDIGDGFWRRIDLWPFTQQIAPDKRDPKLLERLLEERNGILVWMVEGCLKWQQGGLQQAAAITQASAEYRDECDTIGQWLDERCVQGAQHVGGADELYRDYTQWAMVNGLGAPSKQKFGRRLSSRGFRSFTSGKRQWQGVALKLATMTPIMSPPNGLDGLRGGFTKPPYENCSGEGLENSPETVQSVAIDGGS